MKPIHMDVTRAARDRLLVRTTQILVGAALLTALLVRTTPGTFGTPAYWISAPLFALGAVGILGLGDSRHWPLAYAGLVVDLAAIAAVLHGMQPSPTTAEAAVILLGAAIPSASLLFTPYRLGRLLYWVAAVAAVAIVAALLSPSAGTDWWIPPLLAGCGWLIVRFAGLVVLRSLPSVRGQIREIGLAYVAERQASELELGRRRSARLLHDTVLATLTLLAHSGVGVSHEALRSQARNDAHLLRQLRLGEPLFALPDAEYAPEPVEESTLGTTLETVRERFGGLGLDVAWHGASRIALPQPVLDAFLFSISEALENVRRHAGVDAAHVTITETTAKVTAMITDAGRGFVPEEVSEQRLGIKESVIGRLAEVGGAAKVFSSPGAGTTVLLEVPR